METRELGDIVFKYFFTWEIDSNIYIPWTIIFLAWLVVEMVASGETRSFWVERFDLLESKFDHVEEKLQENNQGLKHIQDTADLILEKMK